MIRQWRMEIIVLLLLALLLALDAQHRLRTPSGSSNAQSLQLPPPPAPLPQLAPAAAPDLSAFLPPPAKQEPTQQSPTDAPQQAVSELTIANGRLRLAAVSHTPEGAIALLREEQQNGRLRERHHLRPGDQLHGYQVVAIERHAIRLQTNGQEFELLMFERK